MFIARAWGSKFARMSSTLAGRSGRVYVQKKILQVHPKKPELNVYLAHCENRPFVLKHVSQSTFELSEELKRDFGDNSRIRTHTDYCEEERVLVYDYFDVDLLSLAKNDPDLPIEERKFILRELGLALKDMHAKHWVHLDVKPNNVMLNLKLDERKLCRIERVVLTDLDCALKLGDEKLLNYRVGNVMWRSPEGQMGKGVAKPSEVFSFGLVCLFTITGAETLHPDFDELKEQGLEPELVILSKMLSMFGPSPPGLITHVNDEYWSEMLTGLSQLVEAEDPNERFEQWEDPNLPNLDSETKTVIMKMTNLDPEKRPTIDQVLEDPWWKHDGN